MNLYLSLTHLFQVDDEVDTDFSFIIILFEVNEEVEADISFFIVLCIGGGLGFTST